MKEYIQSFSLQRRGQHVNFRTPNFIVWYIQNILEDA